jgi:beta-glucosidase
VKPLWPFGYGLSYTTFRVDGLCVDRDELPTDGGQLAVSVDVTNTGDRAGDEVVQLYVRDDEATVARPIRELRGFRRVSLQAGECRTVTFRLSVEQFAYTGADHRRVIEPGTIGIAVGTSSVELPLTATVTLTGPTIELCDRQHYLTETVLG